MYMVYYFGKTFALSALYATPILSSTGGGTIAFNGVVRAMIAGAAPGNFRSAITHDMSVHSNQVAFLDEKAS
jgi:hypothetical protein